MPLDQIVETMVLIAGIVSIVVEILKAVFIDPYFPDSPRRTASLRGLNYLLNLLLLLLFLFFNHALDGSMFLVYLALAFGQSVGSHAVQQTFSGSGTVAMVAGRIIPKPGAAAGPASDTGGDVENPAP